MTIEKPFTEAQIAAYRAYEKARSSGKFDMLDQRALVATGLSRDTYVFVMDNYDELRKNAEILILAESMGL